MGPFDVIERHGTSFTLRLPAEMSRVHPTFHASLLKKYSGDAVEPPAPILIAGEDEYEVEAIIDHRLSRGKQ